jgi:hypothetical protein
MLDQVKIAKHLISFVPHCIYSVQVIATSLETQDETQDKKRDDKVKDCASAAQLLCKTAQMSHNNKEG